MAEKNKVPAELEEKIQALAGEIYVQVEEKVADFILNQQATKPSLSDEDVAQHPSYRELLTQYGEAQTAHEALETKLNNATHEHQQQLQALAKQIAEQQQQIDNGKALNEAKLTDTESALQKKLADYSKLAQQHETLLAQQKKQQQELEQSIASNVALAERIAELQTIEKNLLKNDQAKAATLEVQNHQITQLNNQVNTLGAELEFAKTEQSKNSDVIDQTLQQSQQNEQVLQQQVASLSLSVKDYETQISALSDQLKDSQKHQEKIAKQHITTTEKNNLLIDEVKQQRAEILSLQQQLEHYQSDISQKEQQLAELSNEQQQALVEKQQRVSELEAENVQLNEKLAETNRQLSDAENQQTQHETLFNQLKSDHSSLTQDKAQLEAVIEQTEQQLLDEQTANKQHQQAYQQQLEQLNQRLADSEQQQSDNARSLLQLQQSYDNLAVSFEQAQLEIEQYQKTSAKLASDVEQANQALEQNSQRFAAQIEKRDKQEAEYNKARETIKYLRDENADLSQQLEQQVAELENKLTEYRLRFEYAQKELAKKQ